MSVTFAAEQDSAVTGYVVICECRTNTATVPADTYDGAVEAMLKARSDRDNQLNPLQCDEEACGYFTGAAIEVTVEREDGPSVNVANGNVRVILEALGYDTTPPVEVSEDSDLADALVSLADSYECGTADADDFLGRVLIALAAHPEDPGAENMVAGRGAVFFGGRPEGYLASRLEELREVAEFAREHSVPVHWG